MKFVMQAASAANAPSSSSRGDSRRFVVVSSMFLLGVSNAVQWITYSPLVDEVKSFFNVTSGEVDLLSSIYMFTYVAAVFLSCKSYEIFGLRQCLLFVCATNFIGSVIKLIAVYLWRRAFLLFISQFFNAIAQVFLIATPPLVTAVWFPAPERTMSTTVMSIAAVAGVAIGLVLPTWFVGPSHQSQDDFANLFWAQFVLAGLPFALFIFFVPVSPKYPPSAAAEEKSDRSHPRSVNEDPKSAERTQLIHKHQGSRGGTIALFSTIVDSWHLLQDNRPFALLALAASLELGIVWAVATVLAQLLKPFGVSESQTGWIGFGNSVSGAVLAPFVAYYVDRHRNYKLPLQVAGIAIAIMITILTVSLHFVGSAALAVSAVTWIVCGIAQNMMAPIMFEFGVELTFPTIETTTSSILLWGGSALSLALIAAFGAVLGNNPSQTGSLYVFGLSSLAAFAGAFVLCILVPVHRREMFENSDAVRPRIEHLRDGVAQES